MWVFITRLLTIIAYCLINQQFEIWVWWTCCHPSLKQRMLTWQKCWMYGWFLAGGCYVRFQCQHSTLFSSAYATLQTDTDKFEKLQIRFRFLIASGQPVFWPFAKSQPLFGSRPILWASSHTSLQGGAKSCCADESRGTRWDDQKNEVITFSRDAKINTAGSTSSGELQTGLLIGFAK